MSSDLVYAQREIDNLINLLADARTENMKLRARVTELEGQHKGLVMNNAILRERPDLPLNRIPAARAMTKLYEDNERLRGALSDPTVVHANMLAGVIAKPSLAQIIHIYGEDALRAALEGRT